MSKQQLIELSVTEDGQERKYVGRFLGFIKDDEFNALIQKPSDVSPRLESKNTQDLMKVAAKFDNMAGFRLIMAVKKVDNEAVVKKLLYVTRGLAMIDSVTQRIEEDKDKKIEASPGKVTFQTDDDDNLIVLEAE